MGVLSSLLPGLRDLRAPLAAGYVFLFDLWLIFSDAIPSERDATGVVSSLYRLEGVVSAFGMAVALSFVAYLIGVFFYAAVRRLLKLERLLEIAVWRVRRLQDPRRRIEEIYPTFLRGQAQTLALSYAIPLPRIAEAFHRTANSYGFALRPSGPYEASASDPVTSDSPEGGGVVDLDELIPHELATIDREGVLTQLMTNRDSLPLYGEYDRLKSEAEFRAAICIPVAVLVAILAIQEGLAWAILFLGPLYLLGEAGILARRAEDRLAGMITSKGGQSFYLVALRENLNAVGDLDKRMPRPPG